MLSSKPFIFKDTMVVALALIAIYFVALAIMTPEREWSGSPVVVRSFEEAMRETFIKVWDVQNTAVGIFWGKIMRVLEDNNKTYFMMARDLCDKVRSELLGFEIRPTLCVKMNEFSNWTAKQSIFRENRGDERTETLTRMLWLDGASVENDVEWEWILRGDKLCGTAMNITTENGTYVQRYCQDFSVLVPLRPLRMLEGLCRLIPRLAEVLRIVPNEEGNGWVSNETLMVSCVKGGDFNRALLERIAREKTAGTAESVKRLLEETKNWYLSYRLLMGGNTSWYAKVESVHVFPLYNVTLATRGSRTLTCCSEEEGENETCTKYHFSWDKSERLISSPPEGLGELSEHVTKCAAPSPETIDIPFSMKKTGACAYTVTVHPVEVRYRIVAVAIVKVNISVDELGVLECTKKHSFFVPKADVCGWSKDAKFVPPLFLLDMKGGGEGRPPAVYRAKIVVIYSRDETVRTEETSFRFNPESGDSDHLGSMILNSVVQQVRERISSSVGEFEERVNGEKLTEGYLFYEIPWVQEFTCKPSNG